MPLTGAEEKLCRTIAAREHAMLDDLRLHVSLPTGLNNTSALDESRERLVGRLISLGASLDLVPGVPSPEWLHANSSGGESTPNPNIPPTAICRRVTSGPCVLLAGHLDTVHDPRSPFRALTLAPDRKTATGPGCVDMKGGLVIAVAALEAIAESGVAPDLSWSFLLNSDEETGSYHSANAIHAEAASGRYAAGIALEPAMPDGGLVVERGGSGQFMIEAHGRAAHVGRDFFSGVSAVFALAHSIVEVSHICHGNNGLVANIGPLEGGATTNTVPDLARAWGNVRFHDEAGAAELKRRLEALATPHDAPAGALPRVVVRHSFNRPAKPLTPQTELLAMLARDAAADLNQSLPFGKTGGVCDGNNMQHAGLPTIDTLGVRGGGLHTPQEWIELASLVERCQLLALVMLRLSTSAGRRT
jgi:glutamate carboxypeptidase